MCGEQVLSHDILEERCNNDKKVINCEYDKQMIIIILIPGQSHRQISHKQSKYHWPPVGQLSEDCINSEAIKRHLRAEILQLISRRASSND